MNPFIYSTGFSSVSGHTHHDAAVLRAAGDDVVVVRTELDFQHRARVAAHGGVGHVDASRLHRHKDISSDRVKQLETGGTDISRRKSARAAMTESETVI